MPKVEMSYCKAVVSLKKGGDYGWKGHDYHEYRGDTAAESNTDSDRRAHHAAVSGLDGEVE
jgi:hypothetical protein